MPLRWERRDVHGTAQAAQCPHFPKTLRRVYQWTGATQMPHSRRRGRCSLERPRLLHRGSAPMPLRRAAAAYPCRISPECPAVATYRRHASREGRSWQYTAVVRFRAAIRGGFFASCVPEGALDGKSASSWQHIAAVHPKRAGFGKICAPCIRKAPQTGVRGCTARRSCHEGAPFAARAPQIMHGAQILPSFGAWTRKNRAKPKNCRHFDKNTFKSSH